MDKSGDNTKVCATDIKIGARLSIAGLVKMERRSKRIHTTAVSREKL